MWRGGELTSGQASHLRGVLSWLDSSFMGRPCRAALSALVARQYYDDTTAIPEGSNLHASLRYLQAAVRYAPAVPVPLLAPPQPPIVVYTDASLEDGRLRIGAKVLVPGRRPSVVVYDPSQQVTAWWCGHSDHIINQGELLAAPVLASTVPELLRARDIL